MTEFNPNSVLRDLRYKPNFSYGAHKDARGVWWIRITMWVENSRNPMVPWEIKRGVSRGSAFDDYDVDRFYDRFIPSEPEEWYTGPRPLIEVVGNYPIPYFELGQEDLFVEWFKRTIRVMEDHETDEWLRYKGELLHDPHKEN